MKNTSRKLNWPKDPPTENLNKILEITYNELLLWFAIVTFSFATIFIVTFLCDYDKLLKHFLDLKPCEPNTIFGSFNPDVYKFHLTMILSVVMFFLIVFMALVNGKSRENEKDKNRQMIYFMMLSTTLLCLYIFLTGGFLDSPFSPVLSIYIAGFLLLQDRNDLKKHNIIILSLTSIYVTAPYFLYSILNTNDITYFFTYSTNDTVVNTRLVFSFGLALFSIYSGQRINNKINAHYATK